MVLKTHVDIHVTVGHKGAQQVIERSHYEEAEVFQLCLHGPQWETYNLWIKLIHSADSKERI